MTLIELHTVTHGHARCWVRTENLGEQNILVTKYIGFCLQRAKDAMEIARCKQVFIVTKHFKLLSMILVQRTLLRPGWFL